MQVAKRQEANISDEFHRPEGGTPLAIISEMDGYCWSVEGIIVKILFSPCCAALRHSLDW